MAYLISMGTHFKVTSWFRSMPGCRKVLTKSRETDGGGKRQSGNYIKNHFESIKRYANVIENRLDDAWCTMEHVLEDNARFLELAQRHNVNYVLIDDKYEIDFDLS